MATIRVKILRDYKDFRKGQVVHLTPNEAFGLTDKGIALVTRDFTEADYHAKRPFKPRSVKEALSEESD